MTDLDHDAYDPVQMRRWAAAQGMNAPIAARNVSPPVHPADSESATHMLSYTPVLLHDDTENPERTSEYYLNVGFLEGSNLPYIQLEKSLGGKFGELEVIFQIHGQVTPDSLGRIVIPNPMSDPMIETVMRELIKEALSSTDIWTQEELHRAHPGVSPEILEQIECLVIDNFDLTQARSPER